MSILKLVPDIMIFMIICVIIAGVVILLLRNGNRGPKCPQCGGLQKQHFNVCPYCGFQLRTQSIYGSGGSADADTMRKEGDQ